MMRTWVVLVLTALAVVMMGCGKQSGKGGNGGAKENDPAQGVDTVLGAGATFPYPLYAKWGHDYNAATKVKLNYQSIGSGGGIQQIKAKTVDFGASDAPLKASELDEAGLVQFPMIMGGVVPVVHLEGVESGSLVLDGSVLASLFLGEIKKWNDDRVKALNPGMQLPDKDVTIIHRADGSGTTWIFTNYLTKASAAWAEKVGNDKAVSWPVGAGGKGNEGVAVYVQRVDGALGYVEYAYATQNKLNTVKLKNSAGQVVAPGTESFQAAAANADWQKEPGFYVVLTNQPGEGSWPIVGASFILLHKNQSSAAKAKAALRFFDYAFREGDQAAKELDYVSMPAPVVDQVRKMWAAQIRADGKPVWP